MITSKQKKNKVYFSSLNFVCFVILVCGIEVCVCEKKMKDDNGCAANPLRLTSLNHISLICRSVDETLDFYQNILGFFPIRRPGSFNFDGAWLFNYGIGIHLLQSEDPEHMPEINHKINPKDNHISFQCESMVNVEKKLKEMEIEYVRSRVEEGGVYVDQLFFHDPDGMTIEICNCNNLPVVPLSADQAAIIRSCPRANLTVAHSKTQQHQLKPCYSSPIIH